MITRPALKLNWEGTRRILDGAAKHVTVLGIPMSVAVVDEGGHLLGFMRTDNGKPHNIRIALAKARSAASNRIPTGRVGTTGTPLNDVMAIAIPLAAGPENYVTFPGGVPIIIEGHCVGGVGVSGGTGEQDAEVAQAGVANLTA